MKGGKRDYLFHLLLLSLSPPPTTMPIAVNHNNSHPTNNDAMDYGTIQHHTQNKTKGVLCSKYIL